MTPRWRPLEGHTEQLRNYPDWGYTLTIWVEYDETRRNSDNQAARLCRRVKNPTYVESERYDYYHGENAERAARSDYLGVTYVHTNRKVMS